MFDVRLLELFWVWWVFDDCVCLLGAVSIVVVCIGFVGWLV